MQLLFQNTRLHSSTILRLFVLVTLLLQGLMLFLTLFNGAQIIGVAHKPVPSLVQMVDGHSIQARPMPPDYRSPEVISLLVQEWAPVTMNWSGTLPDGQIDPGVRVGNHNVPTAVAQASFLLSEDFRKTFLKQIAEMVSSASIFSRRASTVLKIPHDGISAPQQIGKGQWVVNLVSNLFVFDQNNPLGEPMPFNKKIYLQTIPKPRYPLEGVISSYQKVVYGWAESQLEIYHIEDIR